MEELQSLRADLIRMIDELDGDSYLITAMRMAHRNVLRMVEERINECEKNK